MPLIVFQEIIDLLIMVGVIGFIFKDVLQPRVSVADYDPLKDFRKKTSFFSDGFKNAAIVAAPAIALHELGHKISAISFGLEATFHAAYTWLGIGLLLKVIGAPFIFFVPGFVSYSGAVVEPLARALIAFSGPAVNLLLFLFATASIKRRWFKSKYLPILVLTKQINLFLFIFNMLPFGFFDRAHVLQSLMQAF